MRKRAAASRDMRERILTATMQLHDIKGVAPTTIADIARHAGVGQATVYRHFPTVGRLVEACGRHVWEEMRPLTPHQAASAFHDLNDPRQRITRLVEIIDAFYARGALRLGLASRDRDLVPELDGFLKAVEAGVDAHVAEALRPGEPQPRTLDIVRALLSFPVWSSFRDRGLAGDTALMVGIINCAMNAAGPGDRPRGRSA